MIQYCCDRCKRSMDAGDDLRYVVRIEIEAKFDVLGEEPDDDRDHLLELHEILERLDDAEDQSPIDDDVYRKQRFDLCADCYRKFVKNPLGREFASPLGFSKN